LERNNISLSNPVFNTAVQDLDRVISILNQSSGKFKVIVGDDTSAIAMLVTYCAICNNWQGSRLQCNVYNLKFSNHVDAIQKSWNYKNSPEALEYEQIWSQTAKILIISNLDFVQFKDFQAQTLLNIIHNRKDGGLTTILVIPDPDKLIGSGSFFQRMKILFEGSIMRW